MCACFRIKNLTTAVFTTHASANKAKNMPKEYREISIPTEYGHISAKDWGPADGDLVLAFHGWQDNAGTFDCLIPCLSPLLRVVAVDLPGHGLSSHKPLGASYHYMENLLDVRLVAEFFGKRPFTLLGHSMGAGISLMYAAAFPNDVKMVISLDMLKPLTVAKEELAARTASAIRQRLQMSSTLRQSPPVYSREDALNRLHKAMMGSVTINSAKILLQRSVRDFDDKGGVVFNRDLRLQVESIQKMDNEFVKAFLSHLKCQLLMVKMKNSYIWGLSANPIIEEYKKMFSTNCERFSLIEVDGTHHAHLNEPHTVASIINSFLENADFKSSS